MPRCGRGSSIALVPSTATPSDAPSRGHPAAEPARRKFAPDRERPARRGPRVGADRRSGHRCPRGASHDAHVDLAVAVESDREAEALVFALQSLGYQTTTAIEQEAVGRLSTVRLLPPGEVTSGVVIDLLFASSGIEPEIMQAAERREIVAGLVVPIARTGHLMALKVLARDDHSRPQDLDDLRPLLARQVRRTWRRRAPPYT